MSKSLSLIGFALILLFASSCEKSNEPTKQAVASDYLPQNQGAWFLYENWETDSDGKKIDETTTTDTTHYIGEMTINGENAKMMVSTYYDDEFEEMVTDTMFLASNDKQIKLYARDMFTDLFDSDDDETQLLPLDLIQIDWMIISDFQKKDWEIFRLENIKIDFQGDEVEASIVITGKQGNQNDKVTIKGQSVNAKESIITINITGKLPVGNQTIDITFGFEQRYWFGEKFGIIKSSMKPIGALGGLFGDEDGIGGEEMLMIDYDLK